MRWSERFMMFSVIWAFIALSQPPPEVATTAAVLSAVAAVIWLIGGR